VQLLELLQSERWLLGGVATAFAEVVGMVVLPVRLLDGLLCFRLLLSRGVGLE
jgi:hypothetical protein